MKKFELSSKKKRNGRRPFKTILYEIFPDSCVVDKTGTQYNDNGITWLREYCEKTLDTIKGMSLTVEFIDDERTLIAGHGDTGIEDGLPIFNNATMIGTFDKGYIADIEIDSITKTVCIGEGTIDEMRYKPFVEKLEESLNNGETTFGSVEIYKTDENNGIVYLDGWKEKGRIPTEFIHSGYALLGVTPADKSATLLELNEKEEQNKMDEKMLKEFVTEIKSVISETNSKNDELSTKITELNSVVAEKDNTISELNASVEELKSALDAVKKEKEELWDKESQLYAEADLLRKQLAEAQVKERIGELNEALSVFTEDEKAFASEEIKAFNENPLVSETNAIVTKIYAEIGKKEKEAKETLSEQNSAKDTIVEDIFSEINENIEDKDEDVSIF